MSEFDEAMKRLRAEMNAVPTEPCKHGEMWSCSRCWAETLAAWVPRSDGSDVFFGVRKKP